ncbi:nli interacting factor-like phosphatase domain-containing protein [Cyclospora cayetanensis]|uniref:Nli interacting factor-like phosphatase domain-containing protein n=1 Tax=Cyclospora cayetanensis TaxID=88456 RepID=A0A1D3D2Z7_9EIME|nr:nli interacting factor-like phosphatase domain-containing protein [Cyclospora cayetanensis]
MKHSAEGKEAPPSGAPSLVAVRLPEEAAGALPLVIRWRVPEGSQVVSGQILAHLFCTASLAETCASAASDADAGAAEAAPVAESAEGPRAVEWVLRAPVAGILTDLKAPTNTLLSDPSLYAAF